MNVRLLKAKMVANGHDRKKLAEILNLSYWSVCSKLNNEYEFTQGEIATIAKEYNLTADEIKQIFFDETI